MTVLLDPISMQDNGLLGSSESFGPLLSFKSPGNGLGGKLRPSSASNHQAVHPGST